MTLQYFEPRIHPSSPWRLSKRSSSGAILRKAASGTDLSIEIVDHGFRHIEPIRMLGGASWEELKSRFEASSPHQRWYVSTVEPPPILHSNMADIYRQRVLTLYESLQSEEEKAEAAEVLRTLVDQVTLVPEAEQLAIVLRRDLAAILRFVAGKKNPTSSRKPGLELCGILGDEAIRRRGSPACG
ncbi:hypothetical protein [Bradyrhizobium algeriense]|uniref:hypothetical protein n=1 Tax=Bradyrhizobium algeriense TaxID=634784 RepID=UPI00167C7091|nr:hypothetical protein [Bradyrhizobium algeriense]